MVIELASRAASVKKKNLFIFARMSSSLSSSSFSAAVPAAETASSNSSDSPPSEEDKRFLIELEFVQSLSNLSYLERTALFLPSLLCLCQP